MKKILVLMGIVLMITFMGCTSESEHDHLEEHDHSVEIEGSEMKYLTVQEIADLWDIDSEILLSRIMAEFDLKGSYTVDSLLEDIRNEYKFSPALVKDIAEAQKTEPANTNQPS